MLFPWDGDRAGLYKSVDWTFVTQEGEEKHAVYAAQSLDDLIYLIESRIKRPFTNVWIALGTQRMCSIEKKTTDGFPRAIRRRDNIVSFNSIFLDIDVGKAGAYATTDDAFAALDDFCSKVGLPLPSMEVLSGSGGMHVYWCTDAPMPAESWFPLAKGLRDAAVGYGLKFDPQVTIDYARILRVPGSFNYKNSPPTKVVMMEDTGFQRYSYQQLVQALGPYVGSLAGVKPPKPAGPGINKNFIDNVSESSPPVPIAAVAVNCGVISDILEREGDKDSEPLWNLAIYLASFTDDPHDAAHKLSKGHAGYTFDDTEKKLAEKIAARANNPKAGWPSCTSFSPLHTACQTCRWFAYNKSPLHFAQRVKPIQPVPSNPNADPLMPPGYWRDINDNVYTTETDKQGNARAVNVIGRAVLDAGINIKENRLVFRTIIGGIEQWCDASIAGNLTPTPVAQALAGAGVYVPDTNYKLLRTFLVAWMTHLQEIRRYVSPASFGWTDNGKGFTFGSRTYLANGSELAFRGKTEDDRFAPKGDLQPWLDAMPLVYGNAPLETVVASAFAAPLVELVGPVSLVLSTYSNLSGVGKSTAMQLAQSVWGHPRAGMSTLNDTTNSVMKKITDLHSLPVYWDELHTSYQLEKVIDLVFSATQGKAKARLNRDITQAEAGVFTTMFVVASNHGIADTVYAQTEATEAGGLRVFEMEVDPMPTSQFSDWDSRQMIIKLGANYGCAGDAYAAYIARNRDKIQAAIGLISKRLSQTHQFETKERFWFMNMTTLIAGATLANHCGLTSFDLAAIERYLVRMLKRQRSNMEAEADSTMAAASSGQLLLQEMMAELRGKGMIITDAIPYPTGGRPLMVGLVDTDVTRLQDVWMQVGDSDGRVRVRVRPFKHWLREHKYNPKHILDLLKQDYYVSRGKQTIGAGVPLLDALARFGRYECYDFTPLKTPGSSHGASS